MKALVYNYLGLENSLTVCVLKKLVQLEVPTIVFLMETRLNVREVKLRKVEIGISNEIIVECDFFGNGRKGGLCLF